MNAKRTSEKLARQLRSVRQKRIQSLKSKIVNGRYKVDNSLVAKALFLAS